MPGVGGGGGVGAASQPPRRTSPTEDLRGASPGRRPHAHTGEKYDPLMHVVVTRMQVGSTPTQVGNTLIQAHTGGRSMIHSYYAGDRLHNMIRSYK